MGIFRKHKKSETKRTRSYIAAGNNKLTQGFQGSLVHINEDIRLNLLPLRIRCREAVKNNPHIKKYINMRKENIVGSKGITLAVNVVDFSGQSDTVANEIIERNYHEFSKKENFSVCGKYSRKAVEELICSSLAYDGEFFCRIVRGFEDNRFGIALQIIDPVLCDIDYNVDLKNGYKIISGVEINSYGKPVAYYFNTENQSDYNYYSQKIRVDAEDIIHLSVNDFAGQVRGIPLISTALIGVNQLQAYSEAEILAARMQASKCGYYIAPEGGEFGSDYEENIENTLSEEIEPGTMKKLPDGWKTEFNDPTHPNGNYANFVKAQLREVSNALNVAYNSFANDLEGVNYSSIRQGVLAERDAWMREQNFIIDNFEKKIFEEFIKINLLNGNLAPLPFSKLSKFINSDTWIPKRWGWVDPRKDAEANKLLVENGWKTNGQVTAEMGYDYGDNLQIFQTEKKLEEKFNFVKNSIQIAENAKKNNSEAEE